MMKLLRLVTSAAAELCAVARASGRQRFMAGVLVGPLTFGLLAATISATPVNSPAAQLSVGVSVNIGPPALPVYIQPLCPAPGYIWTPGYWAWDPVDGYYWVPGTWVLAPVEGYLWTPGYWSWSAGAYIWNVGYWGPAVGFYGGINYGFGYSGVGYTGGYWNNGTFFYNRAVNNISTTNVTNVYTKTVVINKTTVNNVSYNGGPGGIQARPTAAELAAAQRRRLAPTAAQLQQERTAHASPAQFVSRNEGKPGVAATPKPGALSGPGAVGATRAGGTINPEAYRLMAKSTTPSSPAGRTPNTASGRHPLITAHPNPTTLSKAPARPAETAPRSAAQPRSTPPRRTETAPRPETKTETETPHPAPAPHKSTPPHENTRQEERRTHARSTPPPRSETKPQPAPKTPTETRSAPVPRRATPPPETKREEKHKPEAPPK